MVRVRHTNAFDRPSPRRGGICLCNNVSRSTCVLSVSMSAIFVVVSSDTSWDSFLRRGSWIHSSLIDRYRLFQIWFLVHVSLEALLSEVVFTSAPVPICSKIWEVCFDVITALDDPPTNSGGATRSHHCLIHGGATRTCHDDATCGKRVTMPCDSASL